MSPTELMSAILKAPVDLLWNGGIGTYVKSSQRNQHAMSATAPTTRCASTAASCAARWWARAATSGMTQLGRIEAAQHGVLLNTDFIDNSAGVDTSDHEVNIKILLNGEVQKKKLKLEDRNTLLASMTDEVGELVLNDNYRQNQAISLMERMSLHPPGLQAALHPHAGIAGPARPPDRIPAVRCGDRRAQGARRRA